MENQKEVAENEDSEELPSLQHVSWAEYGSIVSALVEQLKKLPPFDVVAGIARGGLPLAVTISNQLGMPMQVIDITSYVVVGKRKVPSLRPSLLDVDGKRVHEGEEQAHMGVFGVPLLIFSKTGIHILTPPQTC
jgi:orotate phosphoribosyltransferase-like protein